MKLTINTSFSTQTSSQYLLILVDAENIQQAKSTYQINDLDVIIDTVQFKAGLNETLPLIGKVALQANSALLGIDKASELKPTKLAKIAQTLIKASQKKFKQISIDISAIPAELHYLFALNLTQAAYGYDEYKSKKNAYSLEQINLIAEKTTLDAEQLNLVEAIQHGQNLARDLGNCPANICFPEYLAEHAVALTAE